MHGYKELLLALRCSIIRSELSINRPNRLIHRPINKSFNRPINRPINRPLYFTYRICLGLQLIKSTVAVCFQNKHARHERYKSRECYRQVIPNIGQNH